MGGRERGEIKERWLYWLLNSELPHPTPRWYRRLALLGHVNRNARKLPQTKIWGGWFARLLLNWNLNLDHETLWICYWRAKLFFRKDRPWLAQCFVSSRGGRRCYEEGQTSSATFYSSLPSSHPEGLCRGGKRVHLFSSTCCPRVFLTPFRTSYLPPQHPVAGSPRVHVLLHEKIRIPCRWDLVNNSSVLTCPVTFSGDSGLLVPAFPQPFRALLIKPFLHILHCFCSLSLHIPSHLCWDTRANSKLSIIALRPFCSGVLSATTAAYLPPMPSRHTVLGSALFQSTASPVAGLLLYSLCWSYGIISKTHFQENATALLPTEDSITSPEATFTHGSLNTVIPLKKHPKAISWHRAAGSSGHGCLHPFTAPARALSTWSTDLFVTQPRTMQTLTGGWLTSLVPSHIRTTKKGFTAAGSWRTLRTKQCSSQYSLKVTWSFVNKPFFPLSEIKRLVTSRWSSHTEELCFFLSPGSSLRPPLGKRQQQFKDPFLPFYSVLAQQADLAFSTEYNLPLGEN